MCGHYHCTHTHCYNLKLAAQTAPSGSLWNLGTGLVGSDALGDGVSWEALASNLSMPWMCWISTDAQSAESLLPGADISVTELLAPLNAAALPEAGVRPMLLAFHVTPTPHPCPWVSTGFPASG